PYSQLLPSSRIRYAPEGLDRRSPFRYRKTAPSFDRAFYSPATLCRCRTQLKTHLSYSYGFRLAAPFSQIKSYFGRGAGIDLKSMVKFTGNADQLNSLAQHHLFRRNTCRCRNINDGLARPVID